MKTKTVCLLSGIAVFIGSCIPSLYPLYHEKDLVVDERLPGTYEGGNDEDYWKFSRLSDYNARELSGDWRAFRSGKTYRLSLKDNGVVEEFAVHLLKLGGRYYLDFVPVDYSIEPDLLAMSLAPSHIFAWAEPGRENLILHWFDPEWLEDLIDDDLIRISYLERGDRYILTAGTDELQKFILKFANDSTTFMEADTLPRISTRNITMFSASGPFDPARVLW